MLMPNFASVTAATTPTFPLTFSGANDKFVYTPIATGIPETFTIPHDEYLGLAGLLGAMEGALNGSQEFGSFMVITENGSVITATSANPGPGNNGDTITEGNGGAAALGFTIVPAIFSGGAYGTNFTPPLIQDRPPFNPDSTELQKELWLHFENRIRGVNVWIMSDGSIVQDTASPENSNTDLSGVYPWDVNNPAAPYVRSIFIDSGADPQIPSEHDVSHDPYPVQFFSGGSTHVVSEATAAMLGDYTNFGNGYSDCLT